MGFTTLTANVGPNDLSLQVVDPSVFVLPGTVVVDGEEMYATGKGAGSVTLDPTSGRGYNGTSVGLHYTGTIVDGCAPSIVGSPNGVTIAGYVHARKRGEQWDICDRCGKEYPMSALVKQKGLLVCVKQCFDNLTVERRQQEIMKVLGAGVQQEGADLRVIDRSYWIRSDEEVT